MTYYLLGIGIVLITTAGMEVFANLTHRYVMHGWGWGWHESHHVEHSDTFEKNDLYALVFSVPSALLIWYGSAYQSLLLWVGVGMAVYGFLYFVAHDGLVHQRWPFRVVPKGGYLKRLVQAHRLHHAVMSKDGCVSFGFLYAKKPTTLKQELQQIHGANPAAFYKQPDDSSVRPT